MIQGTSALLLFLLIIALVGCGSVAEPELLPVSQLEQPTLTSSPVDPTSPATPAPLLSNAVEPEASSTRKSTATPAPTFTPEVTVSPLTSPTPNFPNFAANPPQRLPSAGRVTHGKTYPPGAYEFIHDQFNVPPPPARVPKEYVLQLPAVPEEICPLTGEAAPKGIESRRPINVRIDNSPQGRPQAGLENADVIWETLAEGGVTRLTVTFHCRTPDTLGPIRSARLIDLQLTPMLDAWFVYSGASQPVTDMIWASPFADRSIEEWAGDPGFYRIDQAPVGWLRTYSNNDLIQSVIAARDDGAPPDPLRGWQFSEQVPPASDGEATRIYIPYGGGSSAVSYHYDPSMERYLRYQGQAAHTTQSGTQLAMDNIIVLFAEETVTLIVEDTLGSRSLHYKLHGEGLALLFRDGRVWDARWVREGENTLVRVVDNVGEVIPLAPGQTAVQIVSDQTNVTWE
ncbi:MAG: DUF3048 domain-containing protein [Chloroflexota bacterium]|nr:DUF3048 domain-containing protein [Chloroflexota bacterium]